MNSKHHTFTYESSREEKRAQCEGFECKMKIKKNTTTIPTNVTIKKLQHSQGNQRSPGEENEDQQQLANNKTNGSVILYDDFVIVRTNVCILDERCEWLATVI